MNDQIKNRHDKAHSRVPALVARFNGAIKYLPMVLDHPEWTDDQCIEFAKKNHAIAIAQLSAKPLTLISVVSSPESSALLSGWNNGVPYCRNIPTNDMIKEANK